MKVSYDTIARWARRGKWRERVEQLRAISGVGTKDVAATLQIEAEWLTPDLLRGLQFRVAAHMAERINRLPLDSPEDYAKLVDVLDKMDAIIHRHTVRTSAKGATEAAAPIRCSSTSSGFGSPTAIRRRGKDGRAEPRRPREPAYRRFRSSLLVLA